MRILAIVVTICTLLCVGCSNEQSDYDAGIAAYKREHYAVALSNFESRAMKGDPVAQFCLGYMYKHGKGVKADDQTALDWYTKAAAQSHVPALNNSALIYGQMAMEWRLSLEDEAFALLREGKDFEAYIGDRGREIIHRLTASLEGFIKGIDIKNPTAQYDGLVAYNLALFQVEIEKTFYGGDSEASKEVHENIVILLEFAAIRDYPPAQNKLAQTYRDGLYGITQDPERARDLLAKAAKKGYAAAQFNLAEMIRPDALKMYATNSTEASKLHMEALDWYTKAAEQGYAPAQYKLGQIHDPVLMLGESLDSRALPKFQQEALKWYSKAAAQDYIPAQTRLAIMYYSGNGGIEKNVERSLRLALEAAQAGEAFAQYILATEFKKRTGRFHLAGLPRSILLV